MDKQIRAQQATIAQAEQSWQAAQAQTQAQTSQLAYFQITAPFTGVVGDIPVKVGEVVRSGYKRWLGWPRTTTLEVNFSVPAERAGAAATPVARWSWWTGRGNPRAPARFEFIAPNADPATQLVLVKALFAQPERQPAGPINLCRPALPGVSGQGTRVTGQCCDPFGQRILCVCGGVWDSGHGGAAAIGATGRNRR